MLKKVWFAVLSVAVLGLIGVSQPANAVHDGGAKPPTGGHEHSPAPFAEVVSGVCGVVGTVDINDSMGTGGVDPAGQLPVGTKNHNHFEFGSTTIECAGGPVPGRSDVFAAGGTDGQGDCDDALPNKDPKCLTDHGESATNGWSHKSGYAGDMPATPGAKSVDDIYSGTNENPDGSGQCTNCGEIWVQNYGPDGAKGTVDDTSSCQDISKLDIMTGASDAKPCANDLKFCRGTYDDGLKDEIPDVPEPTCSNVSNGGTLTSRGGGNVLAWGHLVDWKHDKALVVCFVADLELTPLPNPSSPTNTKVTNALITGTAYTWGVNDKAACQGKKNNKPT